METTREAINKELRTNAVCDPVRSYVEIHRTIPGTEASEQRAKVTCWVYRYTGSPPEPRSLRGGFRLCERFIMTCVPECDRYR